MGRDLKNFCELMKSMNFIPSTIIDVGVCYGTPELYTAFPDAYLVLIEPLSSLETCLKKILDKYSGEYHMLALSDAVGKMPLSISRSGIDGSTLLDRVDAEKIDVQVSTLDDLFSSRFFGGPLLIKTDCQGFDLKVLRGRISFISGVDVIIVESNLFPANGDPCYGDLTDIVVFMKSCGFVVYDILGYYPRPYDGALGFVDLVFVKEAGFFRQHLKWN